MKRYFLGVILILVAAAVITHLLASTYDRLHANTKTYSYFSEVFGSATDETYILDWTTFSGEYPRMHTRQSADTVSRDFTQSWHAFTIARDSNRPEILSDFFGGPALERAQQATEMAQAQNTYMAVLRGLATPQIFHLDGSVLQIDSYLLTVRFSLSAQGDSLDQYMLSSDHARSILTSETTGWRIFSHELEGIEPWQAAPAGYDGPPIYGLNYYPANAPWSDFWANFNAETLREDFAAISQTGANAIRIFIPRNFLSREALTAPPDGKPPQSPLEDLATLLATANAAGLQVVPVLFDLYSDHRVSNWAGDIAYMEAILPVLAAAPNVAFVDLKNEPDLDFASGTRALHLAWLRTLVEAARLSHPRLAYTIGWAHPDAAHHLADHLDLITYHDYGPLDQSAETLARLQARFPEHKVMITEIGETSYETRLGLPSSPEKQAKRLEERLEALAEADGLMVWAAFDFTHIDPLAIPPSPLVRARQKAFGIFTTEGEPKPAFDVVQTYFKRHRPSSEEP